jgi:hypothetical protein
MQTNPPCPPSWSDERLCTRAEAASYAKAIGYPVSKWVLDRCAVTGEGPPIRYYDRKPLYQLAEFKAWLKSRTRRVHSTAELQHALNREAVA